MKQLANNLQEIILGLESELGMKKKFQTDRVNYVSSEQENVIICTPRTSLSNLVLEPSLTVSVGAFFKHKLV